MVYVPFSVRTLTSTKVPDEVTLVGRRRVVPSGLRMETLAVSAAVVRLTGTTLRLTRWPTAPVKVAFAFCPGTLVERVSGAPPGVIEATTSGGTSYSVSDMLPMDD